jgi:hypothetical protein
VSNVPDEFANEDDVNFGKMAACLNGNSDHFDCDIV